MLSELHQPLGGLPSKVAGRFGTQTVAVLRAELGEVARFQRLDQVVAYAGLDIEIKQSGKWQGQAKLSKRGSGLVRRMLYMAAMRCTWLSGSSFGVYYHRLLMRGLGKKTAPLGSDAQDAGDRCLFAQNWRGL